MSFQPIKNASEQKNKILAAVHAHVHPGRVERLLSGGIDLVPHRREGYRLWDIDGRELIDLHINGGTFNLGHRHPELIQCLNEALEQWDIGNHHFPSGPRAALAEALIASIQTPMQYVVFTSSGSESNDVAIKSARWATKRQKIVAVDAGYHGRTGLSGAAGDDETARYFSSDDPEHFIKVPFNDLPAMAKALANRDVAMVLMETIPATAGFAMPDPEYLPGVKALCEKFGSLYAADEVQTGLGRSGQAWAVEAYGVEPDMLITGKGLSGGLYPISAVIMKESCGAWLKDNGWGHVSTFGGAELGCVVALKALQMSTSDATLKNVQEQASYLRAGLEALMPRFPFFESIRQKGLIFGLKFRDSLHGYGMMKALYENGIWAIVAGFDESVLQFKPGLLADRALCDEILQRFEKACIWLVANLGALMMGEQPSDDDPSITPIRELAQSALSDWSLDKAKLSLIKHRENTVFRVDAADGERYALRVHRHGYHTDEELASEVAWTTALRESGIATPQVILNKHGQHVSHASSSALPETRQLTLVQWVDGSPFDDLGQVERGMASELIERYELLGQLAAQLHNQAQDWTPPEGFVRQRWDADGLLGKEPLWGRFWENSLLDTTQQLALRKARIVLKGLLEQLGTGPDIFGLIHADFLPENILMCDGKPLLIDFDDSGYGWHLFEMATSLLPHSDQPFFDDLCIAYRDGYRQHRELSDEHYELLPAFILLRGLSYLGWLETRAGSLQNGERLTIEVGKALCDAIPELLDYLNTPQRMGVEILARLNPLLDPAPVQA